jgi:hypothetical protein
MPGGIMKDKLADSIEDYAVWLRHEGRGRAPGTIEVYCRSTHALARHIRERGLDSWDHQRRHRQFPCHHHDAQ